MLLEEMTTKKYFCFVFVCVHLSIYPGCIHPSTSICTEIHLVIKTALPVVSAAFSLDISVQKTAVIIIFGIAMLFTNRGNINDKKTNQQKQNSNPSPDG